MTTWMIIAFTSIISGSICFLIGAGMGSGKRYDLETERLEKLMAEKRDLPELVMISPTETRRVHDYSAGLRDLEKGLRQ